MAEIKKMPNLILDYASSEYVYSDLEHEDKLLDIFQRTDAEVKVQEILEQSPPWPLLYHLSPLRKSLLSWYEFASDRSLLEVGAGCGALTGLFCEKLKEVVAVELTEKRARIVAQRHGRYKNLTVIAGNLHEIRLTKTFDYVTCVGVLEYAAKFTKTKNPFIDFIKELGSHLKEQGTLIIAIENKFGLKYWAGCREDHTGKFFDSLEGYPEDASIKTFGKMELRGMLADAGFKNTSFYYPLPDYKLPSEIFSDDYLPTLQHNVRKGIFPCYDYAQSREHLFNEKLVADNLVKNNEFDIFANSFLIFAER